MSAQAVNPPISQSQTGKFSAATVRLFRLKDVNYFDREEKLDDENLTIGLFLCKQKNEALVEITLPKDANIHAHEYQLYLPSKQELQSKLVEWVRDEESNDE